MFDSLILLASNPAEVAEGANVISKLAGEFGVNWKHLIAQIINFGLVAYLLYRFAFKPVLNTLAERQKRIADGLQYTEEMEQKLKDAEKEHAEMIRKAAAESKEMLDAARTQAKNYTEKQSQEALHKAEGIIRKAEEAIDLERNRMVRSARNELAQLVVATSGKVLSKDLSKEERAKFTESATKELSLN